jgi:hypothetical protein
LQQAGTNRRRNLNSGQRACIAVEATEIIEAIAGAVEADRRAKQGASKTANVEAKRQEIEPALMTDIVRQKIASQPTPSKDEAKAATKTAEIFGTNRTDRSLTGISRCIPSCIPNTQKVCILPLLDPFFSFPNLRNSLKKQMVATNRKRQIRILSPWCLPFHHGGFPIFAVQPDRQDAVI